MKYLSHEFPAFEKVAGVTTMEGRGWYGMRRVLADQCEEVTDDQRIRDLVGGWTTPGMRASYLAKQKHNPAVQLRVATARAAARARVAARLSD